jgi:hypothetical protein
MCDAPNFCPRATICLRDYVRGREPEHDGLDHADLCRTMTTD